jgi:hypothetical protein
MHGRALASVTLDEGLLQPEAARRAAGRVRRLALLAVHEAPRLVAPRVISDCHFAVPLNQFIPGFLYYSIAVFLK